MFREIGSRGPRRMPDWWFVLRNLPPMLAVALLGPILLLAYAVWLPTQTWMVYLGVSITLGGAAVFAFLTRKNARVRAKSARLRDNGRRATARVLQTQWTGESTDLGWREVKVDLEISGDGVPTFTAHLKRPLHPSAAAMVARGTLAVIVDPGTKDFEIDWRATEYIGERSESEINELPIEGLYGDTGAFDQLRRIMVAAREQGTDGRYIDPQVISDIVDDVRRDGGNGPLRRRSASMRLAELDALYRQGRVDDAEYRRARQNILNQI